MLKPQTIVVGSCIKQDHILYNFVEYCVNIMSTIYTRNVYLCIYNLSHILISIQTSNSHPKNPEEPAWRFTTSYFIDGPARRLHLIKKKNEEPARRLTTSYFIEGPAWRLLLIKKN